MTGTDVDVAAVTVRYRRDSAPLTVLRQVSLHIAPGSRVAIMGPSGAGKSTLLALIGGLEPVQEGRIRVGDRDVAHLGGDDLARYRRETVGFVFQHFGLLGTLTAAENVELAMTFGGGPRGERRARALALLEAVGIAARASHRPAELSGGEAQRVALARALANDPALILADEPTGNLDGATARKVLDLLDHIASERGVTLLTVTHDPLVARRSDRVVELRDGRVVAA
jgi:putative ABC transport system ATP-binding protein